jgi:transcriptional regulator with XRE-family HTH domain
MSNDPIQRLPCVLGKLIQQQRKKRNLTEEQFAKSTGLKLGDVINMEAGVVEPSITEFFRIARTMNEQPAILFVDLVAAWRDQDPVFTSRASDFMRLYRLGYHHKPGDFREHDRAFNIMDEATRAADTLNQQRYVRGVQRFDTVCIYIRMGHISFSWKPGESKS